MTEKIKVWVVVWPQGETDNRFYEKESEAWMRINSNWMRINSNFNTDEAVMRGFTVQPYTLTKGHDND